MVILKNTVTALFFISFLFLNEKEIKTSNTQTYKFVLTHALGKKLDKPAYFYVGSNKKWTLDFRNGDKIIYNIISMNEDNPMCGIRAKDSFGDYADICITKTSGDNTKIEFKYNNKRLTYSGYISR